MITTKPRKLKRILFQILGLDPAGKENSIQISAALALLLVRSRKKL
jgi:hypothetical protein